MAKHTAKGSGDPNQGIGRHHRKDPTVATEGEQTWPVIQARLEAERRLAAQRTERRP